MNLTYVGIKPIDNNKFKAATVQIVFEDFIMITGELVRKTDGGMFMVIANAPWKDNEGKFRNKYLASMLSDDAKTKLENYIISMYNSKTYEYKDVNKCVNLTAFKNKFNKASAGKTYEATTVPQSGLSF